MDYEKKYKEALERAKKIHDEILNNELLGFPDQIREIFPELRKEEKPLTPFQQCLNCILRGVYYAEVPDEKVNEFIVNIVRTRTDELVELAKRHEYTDCQLRESKEEKIRKYLIDELKAAKSVGELKFIIPQPTREECIAFLEKQKEQKHPNGCFTCDEYKKGYEEGRRNGFTAGYNKAIKEVEQNVEQKPAEWSEEDKKNLDYCLRALSGFASEDAYNAKKFLKSLRPSWKPSEEQMEELKEASAIMACNDDHIAFPSLKSLYEHLKKL